MAMFLITSSDKMRDDVVKGRLISPFNLDSAFLFPRDLMYMRCLNFHVMLKFSKDMIVPTTYDQNMNLSTPDFVLMRFHSMASSILILKNDFIY